MTVGMAVQIGDYKTWPGFKVYRNLHILCSAYLEHPAYSKEGGDESKRPRNGKKCHGDGKSLEAPGHTPHVQDRLVGIGLHFGDDSLEAVTRSTSGVEGHHDNAGGDETAFKHGCLLLLRRGSLIE